MDKLNTGQNIISTVITIIFTKVLSTLCYSLIDNIILPIFLMDSDSDGIADINKIKRITFTIGGIKYNIGIFIYDLIKFVFISLFLMLLTKYS